MLAQVYTWKGVDISTMSPPDLFDAFIELANLYQELLENNLKRRHLDVRVM